MPAIIPKTKLYPIEAMSPDTARYADSDGIIEVYGTGAGTGHVEVNIGTTVDCTDRTILQGSSATGQGSSLQVPIKKGLYCEAKAWGSMTLTAINWMALK